MKLFYTSGSPYARIIRVVLRATGLDRRTVVEEVTLRDEGRCLLSPNGSIDAAQTVLGARKYRSPAQGVSVATGPAATRGASR